MKKLSIVIPVYNEEDNLHNLYSEICGVAEEIKDHAFEIIFVDDGSRDQSPQILKELSLKDERVKTVIFQRNTGQTAAMSCGIKMANGEVLIPMDADLQNDPADIPKFLDKIGEGFSCVSGWRKDRKDKLVLRKIPSWTANAIISFMTGVHLHDYGCSMKAYRRDIIQDVELYGEMHRFIPAYASWMGAKVTEIVVNHRPRTAGISKYGISRVFKVILDLVVIKFLMKYFNKPMHFFGAIGFICLGIGGFAELAALYLKLFLQISLILTPLPIIGVMFIIVGVQLIMSGLLAEVLMRTYYSGQHSTPYLIKEKINI